jgi:type I restriction enzyme S subunit
VRNLPNGWVQIPLGEALQIQKGKKPIGLGSKSEDRLVPYINISAFETKRVEEHAPEQDVPRCQPSDTLLVWDGARAGLAGRGVGGFIGSTLARLTSDLADPSYLYYFVHSNYGYLNTHTKGVGIPHIDPVALANISFSLPPLFEQVRIVTKLEKLLSDLDAGVAELKAAQKKLAQYRQSLLKAAVEGTDTGCAFPKVILGDLVATIGQGWSPKCEHEAASNIEQWSVMKTTAIQPLAFDGSHNKVLPKGLKPREHLELKSGDLLVTRAGPRNRVGVTCLVRTTRARLILCDKAYRIRCDETKIDPSFLELVLNAPHMVQRIDELKTGISDSGLNLTQDRFFTLEIPLPALKVQRAVIYKIHHQVELIQNQENSIEISLKQSTAQRQNILKAAFSGQLVPQDPSDEPASELLERIRAERAAQQAVKKPRGRKVKEVA